MSRASFYNLCAPEIIACWVGLVERCWSQPPTESGFDPVLSPLPSTAKGMWTSKARKRSLRPDQTINNLQCSDDYYYLKSPFPNGSWLFAKNKNKNKKNQTTTTLVNTLVSEQQSIRQRHSGTSAPSGNVWTPAMRRHVSAEGKENSRKLAGQRQTFAHQKTLSW